jgi:FkbM family methyltransferase
MKNNSAAKAQNQKGNQLKRESKLEQAIACYQKAIEINPQWALSYFNLGQALVRQEKFDEAIEAYRKAIEINPKPPKFHQHLKDLLQQKKPALKQEKINKIQGKTRDLPEVIKKFNSLKYRGQLLQDKWVVMMTQGKQKGVFLEIGSSDGVGLNNTFCLEKQFSWSGMCVEPNPELFKKLCANRTAITLPYAFSEKSGEIVEFVPHGALGTIAKYSSTDNHAAKRENFISAHGTIKVLTARPELVLELYQFPEYFDFLSLDVEGAELEVLESFNLSKWHPALACIEHNFVEDRRFAIFKLLSSHGYKCLQIEFDDWYYHPDILKVLNPDIPLSYYQEVIEYFCQNHKGRLMKKESFKGNKKNQLIVALAKFIEPQEFNEVELFDSQEARMAYRVAKKFNLEWENLKDFQVYQLLAEALTDKGELEGAIACYQKTIELQPNLWGVYQKLADIYWQQGQLSTAVATVEKAIELNPNFSWFYHKLGLILLELQEWQKAAIALEKAIELNPDFYASYEKLGEALSKLENWSAAVATYQNAGKIKALSYWGENKLGEALMNLDEFEEAIAAFNRAIETKPNLYFAHHNLGEAFSKLKKWEEAVINYQKAIKINPNSYWSYHNLGSAAVNLERWDEAAVAYRKAMEIKPNYYSPENRLAEALIELGKVEEAIAYYQNSIELHPKNGEIYHKLGEVFAKLKRWDEAIYAYLNALNILQKMPWIQRELGNVFSQRTQSGLDETISYYRQAIQNQSSQQTQSRGELLPRNPKLYLYLGNALTKIGRFNGAIVLYNIGLEIKPNHRQINAELGTVLKSKQKLEREVKACRLAIDKNPKSSQNYYNLAVVLTRLEEWDKAANAYLNAIQLNPNNEWSSYQVWERLDKWGKLDKAVQFYQQKIEQKPNFLYYYLNLGDILTQQERIDEAIACYQKVADGQMMKSYPELFKKQEHSASDRGVDFLITGITKGGTTSLYSYLTKHPQMIPAIRKEVNFWSMYFAKGIDWYLAHFPSIPEGEKFLTGEATPVYLRNWEVPTRLFDFFPKIKLITVLRNPVSRTISHYNHEARVNRESRSFEKVINAQIEHFMSDRNPWNHTSSYITHGLYVEFLKHWMSIFPREQFLILKSEDFYVDPATTMKEVFNFLELPDYQLKNYKKFNSGSYEDISESSRRQLSDFFKPYNQELEDYLGMTFNWEDSPSK